MEKKTRKIVEHTIVPDNHKRLELTEEELLAVTGGATKNRFDKAECSKHSDVHFNCVGFMSLTWCDHYRKWVDNKSEWETKIHRWCTMGFFDVRETIPKTPGE